MKIVRPAIGTIVEYFDLGKLDPRGRDHAFKRFPPLGRIVCWQWKRKGCFVHYSAAIVGGQGGDKRPWNEHGEPPRDLAALRAFIEERAAA